jgi:hypothetical protein
VLYKWCGIMRSCAFWKNILAVPEGIWGNLQPPSVKGVCLEYTQALGLHHDIHCHYKDWLQQCISIELNGTMDLCVIFCILLPLPIFEQESDRGNCITTKYLMQLISKRTLKLNQCHVLFHIFGGHLTFTTLCHFTFLRQWMPPT